MRNLKYGVTVALVCSWAGIAQAQESQPVASEPPTEDALDQRGIVRAPARAFEIGVSGGYTQPFGEIGNDRYIQDFAEAGGAVGLSLGYRFNPYVSLEGVGQFHESSVGDRLEGTNADVRGVATGLQTTVHFIPYMRVDPYLTLGAGYRFFWIAPAGEPNTMVHGFEVGRAQLGLDIRATDSFAIGPVAGADVNLFVWEDGSDQTLDIRPSTFVFAGVGGHFDLGGKRVPEVAMAAAGPAPVVAPKPHPVQAPPVAQKTTPERPAPTNIHISPEILAFCKIEQKKAFFEFDKANLTSEDIRILNAVADCFTTGPLKGRAMTIEGNADPRGSDEYNVQLGESRARSVWNFLNSKGVPEHEMTTTSRGEKDATGTDEEGWAYDRRVDLTLDPNGAKQPESDKKEPPPSKP